MQSERAFCEEHCYLFTGCCYEDDGVPRHECPLFKKIYYAVYGTEYVPPIWVNEV